MIAEPAFNYRGTYDENLPLPARRPQPPDRPQHPIRIDLTEAFAKLDRKLQTRYPKNGNCVFDKPKEG